MPLSGTGRAQARALGRAWRDLTPDERPTAVLCSPYARAFGTAELAVEVAGWDVELVRDERLRERDLGMLDGFTKHGIERRFPEEAERRKWVGKFYYRPPGGESWADVAGRVRSVVEAAERKYAGGRILVVTHQAVILLARYVLENLTEQQVLDIDDQHRVANTALVRYRYEAGAPRLVAFNDTQHLGERAAPVTEEPDATSADR
jgi:broad specificity phosphatase PhoE